jgi:hypothetical protein
LDHSSFSVRLFFFNSGLWGYWHCGHSWPIVPASGDSEDDCREADGRNVDWQGKPKFSEKTCPSTTFVHHKIPHDQTRVWTRVAAVGSRQLIFFFNSGLWGYWHCGQPRVIMKTIVEKLMEGM